MARWPYNTARWARLRALKLRLNPICEHCGQSLATQVDHRQGVAKGGGVWDLDNLQSLCASCHSRKTNLEDGGCFNPPTDRRVDAATGWPLDGTHWWNNKQEACQDGGEGGKVPKISESLRLGTGVGINLRTKRKIQGG